jgi:hypothetical protein
MSLVTCIIGPHSPASILSDPVKTSDADVTIPDRDAGMLGIDCGEVHLTDVLSTRLIPSITSLFGTNGRIFGSTVASWKCRTLVIAWQSVKLTIGESSGTTIRFSDRQTSSIVLSHSKMLITVIDATLGSFSQITRVKSMADGHRASDRSASWYSLTSDARFPWYVTFATISVEIMKMLSKRTNEADPAIRA